MMNNYDKLVTIYDNDGKTADRYTIIFNNPIANDRRIGGKVYIHMYAASSNNPTHPQGFWQHGEIESRVGGGIRDFDHLGKLIEFESLPETVQDSLIDELAHEEGLNDKIRVRLPLTDRVEIMSCQGVGAYPYDCIAKDKHPKDKIYATSEGGWVNSSQLVWDAENWRYEIK